MPHALSIFIHLLADVAVPNEALARRPL